MHSLIASVPRLAFLLMLFSPFAAVGSAADPRPRPNIIYIMADDMGYSDIGCYGSEIETPHLDALAADGLRFTQFYNTARCCPTRASLLTGLYPHQAGIGHMMNDRGHPGYRGDLNRHCVTIPEVLQSAGYRSYMAGKWHVTKQAHAKSPADKHNWPRQRGFDRFYGTIHGAGSFFDPNTLTRGNQYLSPFADPAYPLAEQEDETFYYTDAIADHSVRFIREHERGAEDRPFFLYVSFTAAHWPMHAREQDIAKYAGRYDAGYQAIRDARYRRMVELGVIDAASTINWEIPEDWKETEHWEWDKRNMEVYAAMIDRMDQGIGQIVTALQETGQWDDTLLCFFQDNGGCAEAYGRRGEGTERAPQPTRDPLPDDYLQPDMQPKQTRDGYPVRTGKGVMAGPADTYIGYGRGWATVSNTPFREYKHWTHEGGISTPLIVHWPAGVTQQGGLEPTPSHLIDLMATAVDVSGARYPKRYHDGQTIKPPEGESLAPLFRGESIERRALYWEHEGNRAIRRGDDKLVAKGANGDWELYNIAKDRSEQHDLSEAMPERVEELAARWQAYAERANVLPLNPRADKGKAFNKGKRRFQLAPGDDLPRTEAPYLAGRGLRLTVEATVAGDGVLVAQGGTTHGWALYVQAGQLCFATTVDGKRTVVASEAAVSGPVTLAVEWTPDGALTMSQDGQQVAAQTLRPLLNQQPLDGLQVGRDEQGAVGNYETPFALEGTLQAAELEVLR